ncbi:hypothetical protein OGZ01_00895 [Vibrio harveyi]|nr:hypothetical protein [Vibrio harveyi]
MTKYRAINAADFVEGDVAILNLKDVTSSLVFAKSCTRPEGCIEISEQQESISNFGPWSFFFAQANATPAAVIPAIQATQAQMVWEVPQLSPAHQRKRSKPKLRRCSWINW